MLEASNSKSKYLWGGLLGSSERDPILALAPGFHQLPHPSRNWPMGASSHRCLFLHITFSWTYLFFFFSVWTSLVGTLIIRSRACLDKSGWFHIKTINLIESVKILFFPNRIPFITSGWRSFFFVEGKSPFSPLHLVQALLFCLQ